MISIILNMTIAINVSSTGLENIFKVFDAYSFQYFVLDTKNDIERIIIKNMATISPSVDIISEGICAFDIILICHLFDTIFIFLNIIKFCVYYTNYMQIYLFYHVVFTHRCNSL